ncbi:hypothetical protein [Dongshaea marina]|uniref:hypothetical protein n=1 Tax=Dongshaea marina TaxID=2047966 RepID=UPI000D3ED83F|nr:hypothetical protein [Dongshaea marina]
MNLKYLMIWIGVLFSGMAFAQGESCPKGSIYYQQADKTYCEAQQLFFKQFGVEGINRVPLAEFKEIPQYQAVYRDKGNSIKSRQFIRFNMQHNDGVVGKDYLILPILRFGQDQTKTTPYRAPLLSVDQALVYRIKSIKNNISYQQLTDWVRQGKFNFHSSVTGIHDVDSLIHSIVDVRYAKSRPDLIRQQRYDKGVGIVWFELEGYYDPAQNKVVYLKHS